MLKEFRDTARGLPDLLNYALFVDEGVILLKDGAFCAGWLYQGHDLNSASPRDLEFLSASVNNTLCQLGDGWMIHADFIRRESVGYPDKNACAFPDSLSRLIDEERRQHYLAEGAHFESSYRLVITYKPASDVEAKFMHLFIKDNPLAQNTYDKTLHFFNDKISHIENSLSKLLFLERMDSQRLLTHVHTCITGLSQPLHVPKIPVYLDTLLGTQDLIGGLSPKIGTQFIQILSLTGFPLETEPGILHVLEQLPIAFRWSNRFIPLDAQTAIGELKKYRRNWLQKRQGLMGLIKEVMSKGTSTGMVNRDAMEMKEDVEGAIQEAESGLVCYGYYTSTLILMGAHLEELDEAAKLIIKTIELRGFQARMETINALEAYLGSLPGHGYHNIRKPLIHSLNLADILPLTSVWAGLAHNPCPYYPPNSPPLLYAATNGATPFRFNLHVRDVGHTCIFGPTGNGKSTLIGLLCAQFLRYPKAQVFIFDKGFSAYPLCKAVGGSHYYIAGGHGAPSFYPLKNINEPKALHRASEWLEILLECQGKTVTDKHRKEIRRSLQHLAEQEKRTLTHLQSTVQDQELKDASAFYTLSGEMGEVLDAESDSLGQSHFQVFEMEEILKKGKASFLPTILHIFNQIENELQQQRPTLIVIEEGHNFLEGRFGAQLETWFTEKRKANVSVIFVDQTISKIAESPYRNTLLENCYTQIFLPNIYADTELNAPYYHKLGLTDTQIHLIKTATPKRHYYYNSPLGKRLIDLGLGKVALSFVGVDGKSDREQIDALINEHQEQWVYHWLKQRQLSEWAEYWQLLNTQLKNAIGAE